MGDHHLQDDGPATPRSATPVGSTRGWVETIWCPMGQKRNKQTVQESFQYDWVGQQPAESLGIGHAQSGVADVFVVSCARKTCTKSAPAQRFVLKESLWNRECFPISPWICRSFSPRLHLAFLSLCRVLFMPAHLPWPAFHALNLTVNGFNWHDPSRKRCYRASARETAITLI